MREFHFMATTLSGLVDPGIARAAIRAGEIGAVNAEYAPAADSVLEALHTLRGSPRAHCGVRLDPGDFRVCHAVLRDLPDHVGWAILAGSNPGAACGAVPALRKAGVKVLVETSRVDLARAAELAGADGVIARGNEAGGWVAQERTFLLFHRLRRAVRAPVWLQGGLGPRAIAAGSAAGAAGVILDAPLALVAESPVPFDFRRRLAGMDGHGTVCLGREWYAPFRMLAPCRSETIRMLAEVCARPSTGPDSMERRAAAWHEAIRSRVRWADDADSVQPLGRDACLARRVAARYGDTARSLAGWRSECRAHLRALRETPAPEWAWAEPLSRPEAEPAMTARDVAAPEDDAFVSSAFPSRLN